MKMKITEIKRKDNKSLTAKELIGYLYQACKKNPKLFDKPVTMYSDAEGNSRHGLFAIEISKQDVTLVPDDNYID
jgi:hypothetical protein